MITTAADFVEAKVATVTKDLKTSTVIAFTREIALNMKRVDDR